jgi:hypothetical protein
LTTDRPEPVSDPHEVYITPSIVATGLPAFPSIFGKELTMALPISKNQAVLRLIGAWCARVIEDESYAARIGLRDMLAPDIIGAVAREGLLADYDDLGERLDKFEQELVRAWQRPRSLTERAQ